MGLRGPKPTYDWAGWFHLGSLTAVRGTHYRCSPKSFAQQARNAAVRIGLKVNVKVTGKVVRIDVPRAIPMKEAW